MAHTIVVGDTHMDWQMLLKTLWHFRPKVCIVAGDFGWWPEAWMKAQAKGYRERSLFGMLEACPEGTEIRFIDGNHENLPALFSLYRSLSLEPFAPAEFYPGLWYQPRGSVCELADGRTVFFCGGGKSVDAPRRTPGVSWFPEEITCRSELPEEIPAADVVISHTVPTSSGVLETLTPIKEVCDWWDDTPDETCETLDHVLRAIRPPLWIAGHLHVHRDMAKDGTRFVVLDMASGGLRPWDDFVHVLVP